MQTHGRTLRVATDWVAMTGLEAGDRYLMVNPYFHMFGLKAGILASVAAAPRCSPSRCSTPAARWRGSRPTASRSSPGRPRSTSRSSTTRTATAHDLSSLRVAVTGAADIPVALIRRIHDELPFSVIITGYGLTEGGTASATSVGDDAEIIATTVGPAAPRLRAPHRRRRGPRRARGRAGRGAAARRQRDVALPRRPDRHRRGASRRRVAAARVTWARWMTTGRLRIVGRSKDMFIVGGFNAYPAEIENALLRHPEISQAAVIGVPDERLGEVGMAFVVRRTRARRSPARTS